MVLVFGFAEATNARSVTKAISIPPKTVSTALAVNERGGACEIGRDKGQGHVGASESNNVEGILRVPENSTRKGPKLTGFGLPDQQAGEVASQREQESEAEEQGGPPNRASLLPGPGSTMNVEAGRQVRPRCLPP
jgi:hypothetical protein